MRVCARRALIAEQRAITFSPSLSLFRSGARARFLYSYTPRRARVIRYGNLEALGESAQKNMLVQPAEYIKTNDISM